MLTQCSPQQQNKPQADMLEYHVSLWYLLFSIQLGHKTCSAYTLDHVASATVDQRWNVNKQREKTQATLAGLHDYQTVDCQMLCSRCSSNRQLSFTSMYVITCQSVSRPLWFVLPVSIPTFPRLPDVDICCAFCWAPLGG